MKNFTKQNFKTNPLWIRLLIMAFMLLGAVVPQSAMAVGHTKNLNIGYNANGSDHWTTNIANGGTIALGELESAPKLIGINAYTTKYNGGNICSGSVSVEGTTYNSSSINWNYNGSSNDQEFWFSINRTLSSTAGDHSITVTVTIKGGASSSSCSTSYTRTFKITYTIVEPTTYSATIKFKSPDSWSAVPNVHIFYDSNNVLVNNQAMTLEGTDTSGKKWYKYTYTATTKYTSATIMFNINNWGSKTDESFKITLGTDYCLTGTTVTTATCPVYCTPPAAPTLNPNSTTVCSGTSFTLPSGYRWYTVATGGTKLSSNTISAGVTTKTTYYAEAGEDGCVSTSRTAYTVNVDPKSALTLKANPTICQGSSIKLSDYVQSSTGTVKWYSNSGMTTEITDPSVARTPQSNPTYYYARATSGVCSSVDKTLTVTLNPKPLIELTSSSAIICNGDEITLANYVKSSTGTVKWYTNEGMTTEASAKVKPTANTTYYAKATSGDCTAATAQLKVTVNAKPVISLKAAPTICSGTTVTFADYVQSSTGTVTWHTDANCNEAAITSATPSQTTTYYVKATNGVCDPVTSSLKVTVSEKPKLTLKAAPTICNGTTIAFPDYVDNNNTIGTVSWYLDEDRTQSAGVTAKPSQTTTYYAKAVSGVCDPVTAQLKVTVNDKPGKPTLGASNTALVAGDNAILTVSNTETGATYTLYKDGVSTGETGTSFTVNEAGSYTVKGKNDCGESDASTAVVITVCNPIKSAKLYFADSNYNKLDACPTYCAGSTAYFVLEYTGERDGDKTWTKSDNFATNLKGTETNYYFTINTSGSISVTIPTCDGTSVTTNTLTYPVGNVTLAPVAPTVSVITNEVITCNETSFVQKGKIQITNYSANNDYIIGDNDNSPVNVSVENDKAYIYFDFGGTFTLKARNKACSLTGPKSAQFTITESDNAPTITGSNSIQPGGSTKLTSDKGANTVWKADGGTLSAEKGASVEFSADANGKYTITAIYNGCETEFVVSVQDDLYVWVRRPIKKEAAYTQFYHEDQNSNNAIGGDLYYKEFATLPSDYKQYNQGGNAANDTCTDKDGYKWYGFIVSKEAIEKGYYFTVHAPNDGGKKGDSEKWGGFYTHTKVTRFDKDMTSDLYFVMDEVESGSSEGWNINAPVVVRASGDAKFNANNFADFVPLYVKDANICGKEVVSFEWQKASSENGAYTKYKSGKGINNIRTREAGWYRCVVTYGDGKGTATSNAIQVTTGATDVADYDSKYDVSNSNLPVIIVNTNGVGFPNDANLSVYPSAKADDLKAKVSVDVIIKKGDEILYDKKARMNYRGSSSLNFKKKSYAFVSGQDSCVFDKSRHDYVKTKKAKMFEVLGKSGYSANDKDWVLYAATPDPSMMRNRLVFDLYQQMRPKEWGVHTTYVELIVDGEYQGVYVFMDKITANEERINITNANGFIVKFDKTDCADRIGGYNGKVGDEKTFKTERTGTKNNSQGIDSYGTKIDQRFEIEYPEKEDIEDEGGVWEDVYQPIIDRFEEFEEALSLGNYTRVRDIIDYDSWADWFVLTEFIKNQDGFRASCIFTFSGEQGDKIKATPLWDQELSMNNRARTSHGSSTPSGLLITTGSIYDDDFPAPFWFTGEKDPKNEINGGLLKDECFVSLVKEKWAQYSAAEGILSKDNIEPMIEAYAAELEEGAQTREATKWPYTGEVRGMTNNKKTVGYFGKNEGSEVDYEDSKDDIISWAGTRVSPLTNEINKLEGEAIIFTLTPENPETTPWAPVLLTVNVPDDYKYNMDFTDLPADAVIKEGNNNYSIKLPQPSGWAPGGDGGEKSATYVVKAKLEIGDETTVCGTTVKAEKQSTITLRETYEDCSED